jgi:hypothetical protein
VAESKRTLPGNLGILTCKTMVTASVDPTVQAREVSCLLRGAHGCGAERSGLFRSRIAGLLPPYDKSAGAFQRPGTGPKPAIATRSLHLVIGRPPGS